MLAGIDATLSRCGNVTRCLRVLAVIIVSLALLSCTYSITGTVCGLTAGGSAVLQINDSPLNIATNGTYTFSNGLPSGSTYNVTVQTQPSSGNCTIANGTGVVSQANVTNVAVTCGPFQQQVAYSAGSTQVSAVVVGDLTGINKIRDIAALSLGNVTVFLGQGDGTFAAPVTYHVTGSRGQSVALYDGLRAVVVGVAKPVGPENEANPAYFGSQLAISSQPNNVVTMLLNQANGTFKVGAAYATQNYPVAMTDGDFNGDGFDDLAVINENSNSVSILLGSTSGTFAPQVPYPVGSAPIGIVAGDFNGDGKLDLVVMNSGSNTLSVLLGNGDGTFQPQRSIAAVNTAAPGSIAAGDFSGDGKLDLAITNGSLGTVSIMFGNGDGTFRAPVQYAVGASPVSIAIGDFNGDGNLDLAVVTSFGDACPSGVCPALSVLLGNGNGSFQGPITYATTNNPSTNNPLSVATGYFVTSSNKAGVAVANIEGTVNVFLPCNQ
jgi:hypothetical protein